MKINKEGIILGVIGILFLAGMGFVIIKTASSPATLPGSVVPAGDMSILVKDDSHMTGSPTAKVQMVEFGDYECPFCAQAAPTLKIVADEYKSNPNFNFVFRNFPLPQHQFALVAAEAAEAAGAQGKFWEMNQMIYGSQDAWVNSKDPVSLFVTYATSLGLNVNEFKSDIATNKYSAFINTDLADGTTIGIQHTPTVYLNGVEATDLSQKALETQINALLAK